MGQARKKSVEKVKETPEKKAQKELAPDFVDDQEIKDQEYEDPVLMKMIAGEEPEKLEIEESDAEKEIKPPVKKKEKMEDEAPDIVTKEEVDMDEEVEFDDDEEEVETKKIEKKIEEEPEKIEFSETVKSALKPYNGNLQQKIEELVKAYNSAQAQLSALNNVQNVIKEIGFDELKPHELIASMKELKTAAFDFMNNPLALDALNGLMTGQIPDALKPDTKTVKDFMSKDSLEDFSYEESISDPKSDSWQARINWENHRKQQESKVQDFVNIINQKKENVTNLHTQLQDAKRVITEKLDEVKAFAVDEYGIDKDDPVFENFEKKVKNIDVDFLKVYFAVFAKQSKIESKALRKIREQKGKSFAETEISRSVEEKESSLEPADKDREKELEETFPDWNKNDGYVY